MIAVMLQIVVVRCLFFCHASFIAMHVDMYFSKNLLAVAQATQADDLQICTLQNLFNRCEAQSLQTPGPYCSPVSRRHLKSGSVVSNGKKLSECAIQRSVDCLGSTFETGILSCKINYALAPLWKLYFTFSAQLGGL